MKRINKHASAQQSLPSNFPSPELSSLPSTSALDFMSNEYFDDDEACYTVNNNNNKSSGIVTEEWESTGILSWDHEGSYIDRNDSHDSNSINLYAELGENVTDCLVLNPFLAAPTSNEEQCCYDINGKYASTEYVYRVSSPTISIESPLFLQINEESTIFLCESMCFVSPGHNSSIGASVTDESSAPKTDVFCSRHNVLSCSEQDGPPLTLNSVSSSTVVDQGNFCIH
jgi:hypothetical protein